MQERLVIVGAASILTDFGPQIGLILLVTIFVAFIMERQPPVVIAVVGGLVMVALGFLLAGPAGDKVLPYTTETGIVLLWIAAIITIYTGYDYFKAGLRHVVDE